MLVRGSGLSHSPGVLELSFKYNKVGPPLFAAYCYRDWGQRRLSLWFDSPSRPLGFLCPACAVVGSFLAKRAELQRCGALGGPLLLHDILLAHPRMTCCHLPPLVLPSGLRGAFGLAGRVAACSDCWLFNKTNSR